MKPPYKPTHTQKNEKAQIKRINYRWSVRRDGAQYYRLRKPRESYIFPDGNKYFIEDMRTGRVIVRDINQQLINAYDHGYNNITRAELDAANAYTAAQAAVSAAHELNDRVPTSRVEDVSHANLDNAGAAL